MLRGNGRERERKGRKIGRHGREAPRSMKNVGWGGGSLSEDIASHPEAPFPPSSTQPEPSQNPARTYPEVKAEPTQNPS